MKFKSITLTNFMRYKGKTTLNFSCDPIKNVTVVLGNNTFGKTTIAQAFRWGLFDQDGLNSTAYAKKNEIVLLNNEVAASLAANETAPVSVEIVIEEGTTQWKFVRTAKFKRKSATPGDLSLTKVGDTELVMIITENGKVQPVRNNNGENSGKDGKEYKRGCVQNAIDSILPPKLSQYYFFDGERWSDSKTAKEEVKQAIDTILGVSGLLAMMKHLKGTRNSVDSNFRSKIRGSDVEIIRIQSAIDSGLKTIDSLKEHIDEVEQSMKQAELDRDNLSRELNDNSQQEAELKAIQTLEREISECEKSAVSVYTEVIKRLSAEGPRYLATLCNDRISALLDGMSLEGKDIPGVTTDTVDYLLQQGKCLCGEDLTEGSRAYQALMELRRYIPPEQIGGAVGKFQDTLNEWGQDTRELVSEIEEYAVKADDYQQDIDDKTAEKAIKERRVDRQKDIESIRRRYNTARDRSNELERAYLAAKMKLETEEKTVATKQGELELLAKRIEENRMVNLCLTYNELIYEMARRYVATKTDTILEELNEIVADNFKRMFNDREKYARVQDDYRIHVYYHDVGGKEDLEEKTLANGEATAINFVFIVSVLELAKRRKASAAEDSDDDANTVMTLPLVLDAPFSSLSNENTGLVARKLPDFAEQIIIFMLDKDWSSSGLDEYTMPEYCYRVSKEERANSSTIENEQNGGDIDG